MTLPNIIVAVDGYSSTGKSTIAKLVAREFSFLYLDSGALYRAVTLYAIEQGLISDDNSVSEELKGRLKGLDIHFDAEGRTCIGGRVVEEEIRTMDVSSRVSPVSAQAYVREYVDEILHKMAANGRVVMDGRDIGTSVFPNAELKIFMTSSIEVRTFRRYRELKNKGLNPDREEVRKNLLERDYIDSHRETSPLKRAEDSYLLDNSDMEPREQVLWIKGIAQGKFGILE